MENENKLIESLHLNTQLSLEDIPDIDLYMDQVIQLFENKFAPTKRNEDEKVLTKTMINNYAKGKLFFSIKNKKYSKEHLILISMIYQMKSVLSINDVKLALEQLNTKIQDEEFNLQEFYKGYLELMEESSAMFKNDLSEHRKKIDHLVNNYDDHDEAYLKQVIMIAIFTSMSNFYRRAAEKIVDEIAQKAGEDYEA